MDIVETIVDTAPSWILAFHRTSSLWWAPYVGTYKHVCAYAYLPGERLWLFYEVSTAPTSIIVLRDGPAAIDLLARFTRDADLVSMRRQPRTPMRYRRRILFNCVSAVRDLIGLDSGALLADRLFRDCLRAGGTRLGRHTAVSGPTAVSR